MGLRRWIGNAAEPKGTFRELMHQGHRLAAIGNLRLHEMQTRIKRENLIRRSIDAAPMRRGNEPQLSREIPEQELRAEFRD